MFNQVAIIYQVLLRRAAEYERTLQDCLYLSGNRDVAILPLPLVLADLQHFCPSLFLGIPAEREVVVVSNSLRGVFAHHSFTETVIPASQLRALPARLQPLLAHKFSALVLMKVNGCFLHAKPFLALPITHIQVSRARVETRATEIGVASSDFFGCMCCRYCAQDR